jgi:Tfp pilus assembly protein PilN
MPKKPEELTVNFLKSTSFETSKAGKVIDWLLTIGKSIVFLTFAVVVFSFAYRFYLDKQIDTLNDKISANINQIKTFSQDENNIRIFQKQLKITNNVTASQQNINKILTALENALPAASQIDKLQFSGNSMTFEGTTKNEIVFAGFLNNLQQNKIFSEITIDNLKSGGVDNPTIIFSIRLNIDLNQTL